MMRLMSLCLLTVAAFSLTSPTLGAEPNSLVEQLKFLEPMVGKTYRGEFAGSTPEKPIVDISRWERAINGQAVRILHSINNGEYGGETIMMWDAERKKIAYWYFTTAGFHTEGTMEVEGSRWTSTEKVTGSKNGITEVRATSEVSGDGKLVVRSQYLQKDTWIKGHEVTYSLSPDSKVVFK